ncbi:hypothetical protein ACI2K4_23800 [Micromonospora sp. NPDC050397]|uniref:TRAFAC clade GTPase domain-containing protein n=1 Tax=Micromonospora sp. NPDC050397 TaxID=3364279 RepID=UPI00384C5FDB
MNAFGSDNKPTRSAFDLILVTSQAIFAISSLLALALTLTDRISLDSGTGTALMLAIFSALYFLFFFQFIRYTRRIRHYKFRLAVTGLPQAGKTVFSILIFDALMNGRAPGVDFSAESRAVIAVYQAIRNLPAGIWPRSTSTGNVSLYEGTINAKRTKIDLEVGDSAGEYWLDFSDEEQRNPGYLEYVISAHGIAHVIPFDHLMERDDRETISREVDDLRLVARLKQQIRGGTSAVPLLIVLSKVDLVVPMSSLTKDDTDLFRIVQEEDLPSLGILQAMPEPLRESTLTRLSTLSRQLNRDFTGVHFIFSSAPAIAEGRLHVDRYSGNMISWILDEARRPARAGRSPIETLLGVR